MFIQLLTASGHLVKRTQLAEVDPGPDVLLWGGRCFKSADQELKDVEVGGKVLQKQRVTNYREAQIGNVFDSNPTWELHNG
jgi:hypothetical protein